jgi:TetR/AcrR family transcriptional regulator, transcriptional repressor for nem operon
MDKTTISDKILDIATTLIQTRGYNAFSFRDIANTIGIKTSSIHYHFPTKTALGKAVIKRYTQTLQQAFAELLDDYSISCKKKITHFLDVMLTKNYASERKMCLGGILASDTLTLPEDMQGEVRSFFKTLEKSLEALLLQGKAKGEFQFKGSTKLEAEFILSLLEGTLLLARLFHDESKIVMTKDQIETRLCYT